MSRFREILFRDAVLALCVTVQSSALQISLDLPWGRVRMEHPPDGAAELTLTMVPLEAGEASFPSKVFFYALHPGERMKISLLKHESVPVPPGWVKTVRMYRAENDSSMIFSVPGPLEFPTSPEVRLAGYGWVRGYYVARIEVLPYFTDGATGTLSFAQKLSLLFQKTGVEALRATARQKKDPHFEEELRNLIINYDDAQPYISASDTTGGWFNTTSTYIKLSIPSDAIYRLSYSQLVSLVSAIRTANPRTFQMFSNGREVPVFVQGESDGKFDSTDYVEFPALRNYTGRQRIVSSGAQEYNEYLNRYTDSTVCWFTFGIAEGKRVPANPSLAAQPDTLRTYTAFVHSEVDNFLQYSGNDVVFQQDPRWTSGDFWGWGFLDVTSKPSASVTATFSASDISLSGDSVRLYAKFASWGAQLGIVSKAHRLFLRLNSSGDLDSLSLDAYKQAVFRAAAPPSQLVNGSNKILLVSKPTASVSINALIYDWFEAEYPRKLRVINDSLIFDFRNLSDRKLRTVEVSNFSTQKLAVYKVLPTPVRISNVSFSASAPYTMTFSDTIGAQEKYLVLPESRTKVPVVKETKKFIDLRSDRTQTDYLIITHAKFAPEAELYRQYMAAKRGFSTRLVNVQDIFDEFGYGYPTAESIREFLRSTSSWNNPRPAYLFIIGDASYDYKFVYKRYSALNYVPSFGQPVSDVALVSWDSTTYVPQMYVGRLPVNSVGEVAQYLGKVQKYDADPNDDWNKRYLFFTGGDPFVTGEVERYRAVNDSIIASYVKPVPIGGNAIHFYKTANPQSDFGPYTNQQVRDAIAAGGVFISYIGHSGTQTWDNGIGEPSQLQNSRGRTTLITDFGCSTGKFAEPEITSFSELFISGSSSSAISYIGNSALGFESIATTLPIYFYSKILRDSVRAIGKAHLMAKLDIVQRSGLSTLNNVMLLTNSLIGDPSVELAVPFKPNLTASSISSPAATITDEPDSSLVHVVFANYGSVIADSVTVLVEQSYGAGSVRTVALRRPIPLLYDTLETYILTKNRAGENRVSVTIDPANAIAELSESDNTASASLVISSSDFKILQPAPMNASSVSSIVLLTPSNETFDSSKTAVLQVDSLPGFAAPRQFAAPLGLTVTTFDVSTLQKSKRYWWRAKVQGGTRDWTSGTFILGTAVEQSLGQSDSLSWTSDAFLNTEFQEGAGVKLRKSTVDVRAISSGFLDGKFGAVEVNGLNVIPNTFLRGHTVVVFDTLTYGIVKQRNFDLYGDQRQADSLAAFLNGVSPGQVVAAIIVDEGANNLTAAPRSAYKTLGSKKIDSVRYRDSWALIGYKGAPAGSVPEVYRRSTTGKAIAESTFVRNESVGTILTPEIGPVSSWKDLSVTSDVPLGASAIVAVIGREKTGLIDTLLVSPVGGPISLSNISAGAYPFLRLLFTLKANSSLASPIISGWKVATSPPPELIVPPSKVKISKSVFQEGETQEVGMMMYNLGGASAESLTAVLYSNDVGFRRIVRSFSVTKIGAADSIYLQTEYDSRGKRGEHDFTFQIDPEGKVPEFYVSNNIVSIHYTVAPDTTKPTVDVLFDGAPVADGDYVKPTPAVVFHLYDNYNAPLAQSDTGLFILKLNNHRVYFQAQDSLQLIPGSGTVRAEIRWRPSFQDGENTIEYFSKDSSGNASPLMILHVYAYRKLQIMNAYNIPNPFRQLTHFTFVLGGMGVPNELRIRIFTVAGRVIQEIRVSSSELRLGLNRILWDGRDRDGNEIANGIYFYRILTRDGDQNAGTTEKMVKMR